MLFKSVIVSSLIALALTIPSNKIERRQGLLGGGLGGGIGNILDGLIPSETLQRRVEAHELSSELLNLSLDLKLLNILNIKLDLNLITKCEHYPYFAKHVNDIAIELGGNLFGTNLRGLSNSLINLDLNVNVGTGNKDAIAKVLVNLGLGNEKSLVHADILLKDLIDIRADLKLNL